MALAGSLGRDIFRSAVRLVLDLCDGTTVEASYADVSNAEGCVHLFDGCTLEAVERLVAMKH